MMPLTPEQMPVDTTAAANQYHSAPSTANHTKVAMAHTCKKVEVEERLERRARGWLALSARSRTEHAVKHRANAQHPHGSHRGGRSTQHVPGDNHARIDEPQQVRSKGRWTLTHACTTSGTDSSLVPEPSDDIHASSISGSSLAGNEHGHHAGDGERFHESKGQRHSLKDTVTLPSSSSMPDVCWGIGG